jgi:hypothetical protein
MAIDGDHVIWTARPKNTRAKVGQRIGYRGKAGYRVLNVTLDRKRYSFYEHMITWFLHTSRWPDMEIDHRNRIRDDNTPKNLRLATDAQQRWNAGLAQNNRSGVRGVLQRGNVFLATITANYQKHYLGHYPTLAEARAARFAAGRLFHGEFRSTQIKPNKIIPRVTSNRCEPKLYQ